MSLPAQSAAVAGKFGNNLTLDAVLVHVNGIRAGAAVTAVFPGHGKERVVGQSGFPIGDIAHMCHRQLVAGVTNMGKGGVGQSKNSAAVTGAVAVEVNIGYGHFTDGKIYLGNHDFYAQML